MILDLKKLKLRSVNEKLQNIDRKKNKRDFVISNPEGNHAVCAGLTAVSYTHLTLPTILLV